MLQDVWTLRLRAKLVSSVDDKHLMRFQYESSVFKLFGRSLDGLSDGLACAFNNEKVNILCGALRSRNIDFFIVTFFYI